MDLACVLIILKDRISYAIVTTATKSMGNYVFCDLLAEKYTSPRQTLLVFFTVTVINFAGIPLDVKDLDGSESNRWQ